MSAILFSFLAVLILSVAWIVSHPIQTRVRRRKLMSQPMPPGWEKILKKRFRTFYKLPVDLRSRLTGIMHVFIAEKRFEPCGGIVEISEEMRVVIAAQACLLLVGLRKHGFFPGLRSILIYPGAYSDRRRRTFDLPNEEVDIRLGESWNTGSVVLSWESVLAGAARDDDGMNVVFHEFAHQLDQADEAADGAPPLLNRGDYAEWARVFSREYGILVEAADNPRADPLLDTYGAENPAEFFAVVTETFFERPRELREEHPELFAQMAKYYGVNPVIWN